MNDVVIIFIVVVISLAAHIWLFLWIKFKIDEGSIVKYFDSLDENAKVTVDEVAQALDFQKERVLAVLEKNRRVTTVSDSDALWCLVHDGS